MAILFSDRSGRSAPTLRLSACLMVCLAIATIGDAIGTMGYAQSLSGQTASSPSPRPADTITVGGRAVNAQTGEALSKVEVRLFSGRNTAGQSPNVFTARTAADGVFLIEGVSPGEYLLTLTRRAFARTSADLRGFPSARPQGGGWMVTLRAGQSLNNIEIRMPPSAVVTGQVFDEDREPMTGVIIEAEQYRYVQGVKTLVAAGRSTTDDRGVYRIYDLSPGRYLLKAQGRSLRARVSEAMRGGGPRLGAPGGGPGSGFGGGAMIAAIEESVAYPETYYPNARFAAEAIPMQLAPGAEMGGIDFTLAPSPTYSVSGRVSVPAAPPAAGDQEGTVVFVTARAADQPGFFGDAAGMTPANPRTGEFVLRNLMPGSYQIIARVNSRRGGGSSAVGVASVSLGNASVNDVSIAVLEDVILRGKVILPASFTTDQLARMTIVPERRLTPMRMIARVDPTGTFSLTASRAEPPRFAFNNLPEGLYLKRVEIGGADLLADGVPSPEALSGSMVVELAADGATLAGSIRDDRGNPVAGARISIIPAASFANLDSFARNAWKKTAATEDDGTFHFAAVAPGRYRAYAFESLDADPSFDADFLSNFGSRWKEVELKARDSSTVELQPIPASDTAMYLGQAQ